MRCGEEDGGESPRPEQWKLPAILHKPQISFVLPLLPHNATSWDNDCQKPPLLTPFLTPVTPRRARDRVPSILALGLFLPTLLLETSWPFPGIYQGCVTYLPKIAIPTIEITLRPYRIDADHDEQLPDCTVHIMLCEAYQETHR